MSHARRGAVGFLLMTLAWAVPASAGQVSTQMSVSLEITASGCTVAANPLSFGATSGAPVDAQTTVGVTCTGGLSYFVSLDGGTSGFRIPSDPRMFNVLTTGGSAAVLPYELYQDAARSIPWGDGGVSHTGGTVNSVGTDAEQTFTVYGRSGGFGSGLAAGTYTDTVGVYVTF